MPRIKMNVVDDETPTSILSIHYDSLHPTTVAEIEEYKPEYRDMYGNADLFDIDSLRFICEQAPTTRGTAIMRNQLKQILKLMEEKHAAYFRIINP